MKNHEKAKRAGKLQPVHCTVKRKNCVASGEPVGHVHLQAGTVIVHGAVQIACSQQQG
jgi:hypothetical protein